MAHIEEIHNYLIGSAQQISSSLDALIRDNGPQELNTYDGEIFPYLVNTIIGQQLSNSAAGTIRKRLVRYQQNNDLTLDQVFTEQNILQLNNLGISKRKIKTILGLKPEWQSGRLTRAKLNNCNQQELEEYLTQFWGVGRWTYQMVAMFCLGNPDIFPSHDSSFTKGLRLLKPESTSIDSIQTICSPYNSYLALHIWAGLDQGKIAD